MFASWGQSSADYSKLEKDSDIFPREVAIGMEEMFTYEEFRIYVWMLVLSEVLIIVGVFSHGWFFIKEIKRYRLL